MSVGEELEASIKVREKRAGAGLVVFDCDARVGERRVLWGTAVVEAPRRRLAYSDIATPEIILRRNDVFARLLRGWGPVEAVTCAVAHPCDRDSLLRALEAARRKLIVPVLVGPPARIRAVADANGATTPRSATATWATPWSYRTSTRPARCRCWRPGWSGGSTPGALARSASACTT